MMATTENKARQFTKLVEDAAAEALGRLQIDKADVNVRVEVDVQTTFRSDFPKES